MLRPHWAVWAMPIVMLLIALAPLPYAYYMVLRVVVCAAAAFLTVIDYERAGRVSGWALALFGLAILFNPIVRVHLTREIWMAANLLSAALP